MSNDIYDDVVFRIESEEMDRERVEMMVDIYESADCVRDHDFRTETNTHQPPQQMVIVLCVHIHTNNTNYAQETHQLLTKITNLTEKRDELLTKNINLTDERDGLLTKNDNLTKQRDQFTQERNELVRSLQEIDGWLYHKFSFYFMSTEMKSWTESRRYCTERGADLIIINNKEEQDFVWSIAGAIYVWIGLTDIDMEGVWQWVDGSTLTSGFWANGGREENCAYSYLSEWYNYQCNSRYRWICEKSFVKYQIP